MSDGGGAPACERDRERGGELERLLAGLTEAQRRAATHVGGPMLVIAGPGAGKTKTLTARLGCLLAAGHARPEELLAVTFTRKAAAEVRGRLQALLGERAAGVRVGTFHSVAVALRPPAGRVLPEGDRQALLRRAAEQAGVGLRALQDALCRFKAHPDAPFAEGKDAEALAGGVAAYEALRRALGAEDLDDLLLGALQALRAGAAPPWRYVSIDEYQDTNGVQRELARALGGSAGNVFAIGDPDQAIYAFRGADVRNFHAFPQDFPGAAIVDLADNFRSTETIVRAAAAVIARNDRAGRAGRAAARPARGPGAPIEHMEAATDHGEGERIAAEIERLLCGTSLTSFDAGRAASHDTSAYSFSDFAVLARSGARADALAAALARAGLPVQRPRRSLLEREEAQDLLAYLRLAADPGDGAALLRVLARQARSALPALERGGRVALELLPDGARRAVEERRAELAALALPARIDAAAALLQTPDEIRAAARALAEQRGEAAILSDDAAAHESDEIDPRAERVAVLTMHGAKGLEFPVVFVAGCEAALLPGDGRSPEEVEEERRLFYVALTRAKDRLYLSWARRGARGEAAPSPFLQEVPQALRAAPKVASARKRTGQMKLF